MSRLAARPRSSARRRTRRLVSRLSVAVIAGAAALVPATATQATATPVTEYGPLPTGPVSGACEVEFDGKGRLWVEQYLSSQFARMDPNTGHFTEFNTP